MSIYGKTALISRVGKAFFGIVPFQVIKDLIDSLWPWKPDPIIEQVGHGFSVGDAIRYNGAAFVWAQADSESNAATIGVVSKVIDADHFSYRNEGLIFDEQFTAGLDYYLSPTTPGLIENMDNWTTGQVKQLIGQCGPGGLELEIDAGVVVGSSAGYLTEWGELATGDVDGVNTDFFITRTPAYGCAVSIYPGIRLLNTEFTIDYNKITLGAAVNPPNDDERIVVDYQYDPVLEYAFENGAMNDLGTLRDLEYLPE